MENKNDIYNFPLATFTFGKEDQNNENNNKYLNNSNQLYNNIHPKLEINKNQIQSSLSQEHFQTSKFNNYNISLSNNNFSNNIHKMIDLNKNTDINNNYSNSNNNFFNTNQSAKLINSNYGGEFTFGQSNEVMKNIGDSFSNLNENKTFLNNTLKNTYHNSLNDIHEINNSNTIKKNENVNPPIFIDENNNSFNSYIIVILYAIYHIKSLRKYIINLNFNSQDNLINSKTNILFALKEIYLQIEKNQKINIQNFKESLSYSFKNRRKFILNQTDDPVDLFFVILNAIHSFSINSPINEISEELCNSKCFSHKFIWMDLTRIDECECNGTSRRLFSNHNYIMDIPMYQIFSVINNIYKTNPNFYLYESYQNMFLYYKEILHNLNMNCPLNGNRCNVNKTHHSLFLANSPNYFIFYIDYNQNNNFNNIFNNYSLLNILKCFVLISKSFDISTLFEENMRNKKDYNHNKNYNLIGIVFLSLTKIYSCAFKIQKLNTNKNILYNLYFSNNYLTFNSFYNLVFYSLKNGLIPIMLFYQERNLEDESHKNINNNINDALTKEQIIFLEKYCINNDNLFKTITFNKIRNNENIFANINNISNNSSNSLNSQNSFSHYHLKRNKITTNKQIDQNLINDSNNNNNIINENNYLTNLQYKTNTYKNKSEQKQKQIFIDSEEKRIRLSLQNPNKKIYVNNNLINEFNNNYLMNNIKNYHTNENNPINPISDDNKKYKKIKNEPENQLMNNKMPKSNNEEIGLNNKWDIPMSYLPYKKEEPIAILPIQNQSSIEVNRKNNSNNYFYKNKNNNILQNNSPLNNDNIKKEEMKQKSNSYKKSGENFRTILNQINSNINNNQNSIVNSNIDNAIDRITLSKDNKLKNNNMHNINSNNNIKNNMYNNPNSFNKNHNLRNMKDSGNKYAINKVNRANFELSANRPSNYRYESNISNISYNNQNTKYISDEIISSGEIKKKFRNKKLNNQAINYSNNSNNLNNKIKNNNLNSDNSYDAIRNRNISKSEDNTNNNIYNFNYIYNNNNFDMNILGNNIEKNNNYNMVNKSYEKTKNQLKKHNNNIINLSNISNINTNNLNRNYIEKESNSIKNNNLSKNNEIGHWTCNYCSNINRDDFIYCKICRRNKKGKILRINTQLLSAHHNRKKHGNGVGIRTNLGNNKKHEIPKSSNMKNSNSTSNRLVNKNNNKNIEFPNNKNSIKKLKRNTIVGFPSSKNFKNKERYNNYLNEQIPKNRDLNNNMEGMRKEYSFTKGSFGKYNII